MKIVLHRRGFTIGELLVVVIIIVLILLLVSMFSSHRHPAAARVAVCQSNVKQIAVAVLLYADDWEGSFPLSNYGYATNGTGEDAKHIDYAVVGDPNATSCITTGHQDQRHVNPYCNLPQTAVLEPEAFEFFHCPGQGKVSG